jgi:hypothetical protein
MGDSRRFAKETYPQLGRRDLPCHRAVVWRRYSISVDMAERCGQWIAVGQVRGAPNGNVAKPGYLVCMYHSMRGAVVKCPLHSRIGCHWSAEEMAASK